jgi:hypothetical protein
MLLRCTQYLQTSNPTKTIGYLPRCIVWNTHLSSLDNLKASMLRISKTTALFAMQTSYARRASASEPSITAFSAMPSVKTIMCLNTLSLAAAAWFETLAPLKRVRLASLTSNNVQIALWKLTSTKPEYSYSLHQDTARPGSQLPRAH